jgi:hypothetical protein
MFDSPKAAHIQVVSAEDGEPFSPQEQQNFLWLRWEAARYLEQSGAENLLDTQQRRLAVQLLEPLKLKEHPDLKLRLYPQEEQ